MRSVRTSWAWHWSTCLALQPPSYDTKANMMNWQNEIINTWWALQIKSKSCLWRNLPTMSWPKVYETPLSFSPHPITSLSGSDHSKSHNRPVERIQNTCDQSCNQPERTTITRPNRHGNDREWLGTYSRLQITGTERRRHHKNVQRGGGVIGLVVRAHAYFAEVYGFHSWKRLMMTHDTQQCTGGLTQILGQNYARTELVTQQFNDMHQDGNALTRCSRKIDGTQPYFSMVSHNIRRPNMWSCKGLHKTIFPLVQDRYNSY